MTKKWIARLVLVILLLIPFVALGEQAGEIVYVIPIKGEIGLAMEQYLEENIKIAEMDKNTVAIIIEIDTYGGRIDATENMSQQIMKAEYPTISFVNTKAESAGVLLTISADKIAMAPGSTIGSAEPIPNTEKILSHWTSTLRTVAQENGRDPELVAAMADSSIVIPKVVDGGRLLNLTTREAQNLGFTDVVASNYQELLSSLDIHYTEIRVQEIPARVKMAQGLSSSYVVPILLSLGFIGLVIEILTPGFGLGGTISLIAFSLYFGGSFLAGNAGTAVILLFVTGIILLTIEAFVPGFGVPGIGGIICIIISIVLAANNVTAAIISLLISLVITIVTTFLLLKFAPRNKFFDNLILATEMKSGAVFISKNYNQYLNQVGTVNTFLRPSGTIAINGELLDVVSEGAFIEAGAEVKVIKVEGRKIIVRKLD